MKVVIQRVKNASVQVNKKEISTINEGLLILLGIQESDGEREISYLTKKIAALRIFNDENGIMNQSILESNGDVMLVSQFTLMASTKKGNRPSYIKAAKGEISQPLYEAFCKELEEVLQKPIAKGIFGADMQVTLVNDGPVTIIIDTNENL